MRNLPRVLQKQVTNGGIEQFATPQQTRRRVVEHLTEAQTFWQQLDY